jgi:hypothetical protein
MTARGKWVRAAVVVILVALVGGRFLAVTTADRLWADALGVQESHAAITRLRMMLLATAFAAAALWCVGNFYLVYRSIGSVRVPRRLGNLEIFEALPRQYLLVAAVAVGLLLAAALSHRADAWWYSRALVGEYAPLGLPDPVLGRDLAYYLFILPWQRTVHSYVTLMAGLVLGVVAVLYAALGAVRWHERRLRVSDLARKHLGGLLAAFALALLWGYRLEPAEYVAGVHNVPLDDVLINIRLPSARLLSALAAVAGFLSLLWMWVPRLTVVVFPWCVLAVVSLFGHYVVPAFSGSVRPPEELLSSEVEIARPILLETAYGAAAVETSPPVASTPKQVTLDQRARELAAGPLWEPFAIRVFLNRAAQGPPHTGFAEAELALYRDRDDVPVPVFLGVRQVDLASLRDAGAALSWENVHGSPYAYATGAVAVHANRISELGHPVFITDLAHADSVASQHTGIDLQHPDVLFGRATNDFAVLPRELPGVQGVRAGGILRRLALAWALQSPKLATSDLVADKWICLSTCLSCRVAVRVAGTESALPAIADGGGGGSLDRTDIRVPAAGSRPAECGVGTPDTRDRAASRGDAISASFPRPLPPRAIRSTARRAGPDATARRPYAGSWIRARADGQRSGSILVGRADAERHSGSTAARGCVREWRSPDARGVGARSRGRRTAGAHSQSASATVRHRRSLASASSLGAVARLWCRRRRW